VVFGHGGIERDRPLEQRQCVVRPVDLGRQQPEQMVRVWLIRLPAQDLAIHLLGLGEPALAMLRHRHRQESVHLQRRRPLRCRLARCVCELVEQREAVLRSTVGVACRVGHESVIHGMGLGGAAPDSDQGV